MLSVQKLDYHDMWDTSAGVRGALRGGLFCGTAGAITGTFGGLLSLSTNLADWDKWLSGAVQPFNGGFTWGAIAGFLLGFFAGAMTGGLGGNEHWINWPLRKLWQHIMTKMEWLRKE